MLIDFVAVGTGAMFGTNNYSPPQVDRIWGLGFRALSPLSKWYMALGTE